jgi:hypothetical protein
MNMPPRVISTLGRSALRLTIAYLGASCVLAQGTELTNPYERVDWATYSHYRADLHIHTIQSDGCHHPEEVVRVYHDAGFSILAITDHDSLAPNRCPTRENAWPAALTAGTFTEQPTPYPDPQPENYPANTIWPWSEFGSPSPAELNMVGIEGVELTCGHHRNAYFVDYGITQPCAPSINE